MILFPGWKSIREWASPRHPRFSRTAEGTLDKPVAERIQLEPNEVYVSVVSLWEIAIKLSLGKLELGLALDDLIAGLEESGFEILHIDTQDILQNAELPFPASGHRDPFDRMLVSQAMQRDLTLVTADQSLRVYECDLLHVPGPS